jgi:two-component sensor histidine kinase
LLQPKTADQAAIVLLECTGAHEHFSVLGDRVRELNVEMRKRRRIQSVLEESLAQRDILMRELHHRVRNNLQMVAGMLGAAKTEASSNEVKTALSDAASRVAAVGAVQQALYTGRENAVVSASKLIKELCDSLRIVTGQDVEVICPDALVLPSDVATPLALIANELLTNAAKYGAGQIRLTVGRSEGEIILTVHDAGSGFILDNRESKRASGIGLVRGLLRQLSGKLLVEHDAGAKCVVSVPLL